MRRVLFSVLLMVLPSMCRAMTLSSVIAEARALDIDNGVRERFTDQQITNWINEGQRDAIMETLPIFESGGFSLTRGTTYYSLPPDFLQLYRVQFNGQILTELSMQSLDAKGDQWMYTTGQPTNYFIDFANRTQIGFYPFPQVSTDTGTITFEYYAQSTDLGGPNDIPFGGIVEMTPYHYGLAFYAASMMAVLDGRTDLYTVYSGEYKAMLVRMGRNARARPSYHPNINAK